MTILDHPLHAPPQHPTPQDMLHAVGDSPDGRAAFYGVSWQEYEALLELVGDGWPRLTYDDGALELVMPYEPHEACNWSAGRFVEAFMDESGVDYKPLASTTLRHKPVRGGLEADQSYYIQNYANVADHVVDLSVDPPPDLAIEIDLSRAAVKKVSIYARLGVPEIWRWRGGRLIVLERVADPAGGFTYAERDKSLALPSFPLADLAAELARSPHPEQAAAVRAFRKACRELA